MKQPSFDLTAGGGWSGWSRDWHAGLDEREGWSPNWGCPQPHPPPVDVPDRLPDRLSAVVEVGMAAMREVEHDRRYELNMKVAPCHRAGTHISAEIWSPTQVTMAGAVMATRLGVHWRNSACCWCPGPDTPVSRKLYALGDIVNGEVNMAAARWNGWPRSGVDWRSFDHLQELNDPEMRPDKNPFALGAWTRPGGNHAFHTLTDNWVVAVPHEQALKDNLKGLTPGPAHAGRDYGWGTVVNEDYWPHDRDRPGGWWQRIEELTVRLDKAGL